MKNLRKIVPLLCLSLLSGWIISSCDPDLNLGLNSSGEGTKAETSPRSANKETRHVLLYYVAGYNDLRNYLQEDINELLAGDFLPGDDRNDNVLLIFSKLAVSNSDFDTPVNPSLTRVWKTSEGETVLDTVYTWNAAMPASAAATLREVLNLMREQFPARDYGMVFTSHATGWVPFGYYIHPISALAAKRARREALLLPALPEQEADFPAVKSIGRDYSSSNPLSLSNEMEVEEFAEAIPYRLKYILFDACLMGGIEMAYALRGKCDYMGASQTEVLADGFNYTTLASRLLGSKTPDPLAVCEDYFDQYKNRSGSYQSATVSLVNCGELDSLEHVCKRLFGKYRTEISNIDTKAVQFFGRVHNYTAHDWYYDLQDVLAHAGITAGETQELQGALDKCIVYSAHTPKFLSFDVRTSCGLSMYLPKAGNAYLDNYYKSHISWNLSTGLVQ